MSTTRIYPKVIVMMRYFTCLMFLLVAAGVPVMYNSSFYFFSLFGNGIRGDL
jgi:hypothetical protein